MKNLLWSDDLLVNEPEIDGDHRKLFVLANEFFASAAQGNAAVTMAIGKLCDYTKVHFGREEESMGRTGYAGMNAHKQEHEYLVYQLDALIARVMRVGTEAVGDDLVEFLGEWLETHIKGADKQYADYLRSRS